MIILLYNLPCILLALVGLNILAPHLAIAALPRGYGSPESQPGLVVDMPKHVAHEYVGLHHEHDSHAEAVELAASWESAQFRLMATLVPVMPLAAHHLPKCAQDEHYTWRYRMVV